MRIIAIDPGNEKSGIVTIREDGKVEMVFPKIENERMMNAIESYYKVFERCDELAIEMPKARGMPTANQEFETCVVIGHIEQAFGRCRSIRIYRHQVKSVICGRQTAKDSNISAAIRDLYPQTGGGTKPAVGTKKQPGPLYGVAKDAWQALAVGLTHLHLNHGLDLFSIKESLKP